MNILVLGKGKTGSVVADMARERGHHVSAADIYDNIGGAALIPEKLSGVDVIIDFTAPEAAVSNIEACVRAGKNVVVGTTGWYGQLAIVRALVEQQGTGLVYGSNFSIGVNLFFEIARTAAAALNYGYTGHITETHHVQKKDAPSGTAITLGNAVRQVTGKDVEITSVREGDVVGIHELRLDSAGDTITLRHDAKSRRGFADGAVRAAEWVVGKNGLYEFKDIYKEMR